MLHLKSGSVMQLELHCWTETHLWLPPSSPSTPFLLYTYASPPLHSSQPIRRKNVSPYPGYQSGWGRTIATAGWEDRGMRNTGGGAQRKPWRIIDEFCVGFSPSSLRLGGTIILFQAHFSSGCKSVSTTIFNANVRNHKNHFPRI